MQAALTSFDDTNSKELEIEVVTQDITRLFRDAEKQLQRFGHQQSDSDADDKVRGPPRRQPGMCMSLHALCACSITMAEQCGF
jgi:hypothetical protein